MTKSNSSLKDGFEKSLFNIGSRFSVSKAFDDFLTMSIAACTRNIVSDTSWYEDEYMSTIEYYKDSELRHEFPKAFASLISEMEDRVGSSMGNDVLGDFFEQHVSNGRNGQYFTPYPICQFMASIVHTGEKEKSLRILDPTCGSGRMLLAAHRNNGIGHTYYGIDIDRTCVKMTALNLFLNGIWGSEVMCANSLSPDDFVISYHISLFPLGIFKIEEKEKSMLWNLHRNSFEKREVKPFNEPPKEGGSQLLLF
jgi:type I restriction-modification system DNA methylase subunit